MRCSLRTGAELSSPFEISIVDHLEPDGELWAGIARCWADVANSGGPVGFPFPPVDDATVNAAVGRLAVDLDAHHRIVIAAHASDELIGWVALRFNDSPLTAHWAKLERLQSHPSRRGEGIGVALLSAAVAHAESVGLAQLLLAVRGGEDLEPFYERHGWREVGRHTAALRFADNDFRDEVLMSRDLGPAAGEVCRVGERTDCCT